MPLVRLIPLLLFALAACAGARTTFVGQDDVDLDYVLGGGSLDTGSQIIVAAAARDFGGKLAICGVRTEASVGGFMDFGVEAILESARIDQGDQTLLQGLARLPEIDFAPNIAGARALCFSTGAPFSSEPLQIVFKPFQVRSSPQRVVSFRPGEVEQIIGPRQPTQVQPDPTPAPGQWDRAS